VGSRVASFETAAEVTLPLVKGRAIHVLVLMKVSSCLTRGTSLGTIWTERRD